MKSKTKVGKKLIKASWNGLDEKEINLLKKKNKRLRNSADYQQVLDILIKNANKQLNYKQIAAVLELSDTKSRNEIIRDLKILKSVFMRHFLDGL